MLSSSQDCVIKPECKQTELRGRCFPAALSLEVCCLGSSLQRGLCLALCYCQFELTKMSALIIDKQQRHSQNTSFQGIQVQLFQTGCCKGISYSLLVPTCFSYLKDKCKLVSNKFCGQENPLKNACQQMASQDYFICTNSCFLLMKVTKKKKNQIFPP